MKRRTMLFGLIATASVPISVNAASPTPDARSRVLTAIADRSSTEAANAPGTEATTSQASLISGTGVNSLEFRGEPDDNGLIVLFGIPSGAIFDWPFAVFNAGKKVAKNIRLNITEKFEGQIYPFDDNAFVTPYTLAPGEFGFGGASYQNEGVQIVAPPAGGIDAKLIAKTSVNNHSANIVNMQLTEGHVDKYGEVTGIVTNASDVDVKNIEIHRLCIEDDGIMTDVFYQILDRRLLQAGDAYEFSVNMDPCEEGNTFVVASIAVKA